MRAGAVARLARSRESGYVAVLTGIILTVLVGLSAFAVDAGMWYVTGQQEQRAADAAALAGVTSLPGDRAGAYAAAQKYSSINGFANGGSTTVTPGIDGKPTRLRVTVSRTVDNIFGPLLGVPTTTITRTAVADYSGPVPMGSPCNQYGNDPDGGYSGTACAGVRGQFWANVNSPNSAKYNGDAYQSLVCASGVDGCTGSTNTDYAQDGYFYTVSVKAPMSALTIQLFDPAFVDVGLTCASGTLNGATGARNDYVTDAATRYASGTSSPYCTGDGSFSYAGPMATEFTVRSPGAASWDPLSFPVVPSCRQQYAGFTGSLATALDKGSSGYQDAVARTFRRWVTLCTIPNPQVGDYLVQVKTRGLGTDGSNAGNRFSIRAYGGTPSDSNAISLSGREKMGIYSNKPGATTEFFLARVPSGAAGMTLNVRLFDVGDAPQSGNITITPPPGSGVTSFSGCQASGPISGTLTNCTLVGVSNATHNGKWQRVAVPIPAAYQCVDSDPTQCWVRLTYVYGSGNAPTDVTSWTASIEGDPVRLVE